MSKYTTGEIAKLCGITVRTVQYYDSRNILVPSQLSEGGRRLYTEDDLKRMRLICFLRELGISINSIGQLLAEDEPGKVISLLLEQQALSLREEVRSHQAKLESIEELKRELKSVENFSVESIADVAHIMKNRKGLKRLRAIMLIAGLPVTILQWVSIILWIINGIWWLFALWVAVAVAYGIWISIFYFRQVAFICPQCHEVFKPSLKEAFWANHTPKTRRLTCPKCGRKSFCVEVYASEKEGADNG